MNTILTDLLNLAQETQKNAYAPYSNFKVGVSLKTQNDKFYSGANVENCAFPSSQCAEGSAIGAMISQGETKITDLLVISPNEQPCTPCGNCRQMIAEHAATGCQVHMATANGDIIASYDITALLPYQFTYTHE